MVKHNTEIYRNDDTRMYWRTTKEFRQKLKLLAIKKNMTMSQIMTDALQIYFDKEEEEENIKKIEEKNYII